MSKILFTHKGVAHILLYIKSIEDWFATTILVGIFIFLLYDISRTQKASHMEGGGRDRASSSFLLRELKGKGTWYARGRKDLSRVVFMHLYQPFTFCEWVSAEETFPLSLSLALSSNFLCFLSPSIYLCGVSLFL